MLFQHKTIMITGAASGIGKATALKFAREGANVAIVDSDVKAGVQLLVQINEEGLAASFYNCDLNHEEEIKTIVSRIVTDYGQLDYAFNNAGIGGDFAKVEAYPTEDWDQVMSVNLRAVFLCMKYQIPHILTQKGAIVNTASLLSTVAYENDSAYVASKFGVLGLTKNAALEYAALGIRINAISPGFTRTPMIDKGDEEKLSHIASKHPIGRLATPEEIAEGVAWLCSDKASYAVGMNLLLDGGYTLQ